MMSSQASRSNAGGFDNCGYEDGIVLALDSRNGKWKARQNGESTSAANKAFNFKDYQKYQKRRNEKIDREQQKLLEKAHMAQIAQENKRWAAVDDEDARHMRREAEKR